MTGTDEERAASRLARLAESLHGVTYYCEEVQEFVEAGMKGWFMSYFAYRSAPLGRATPELVTALFYNIGPRMVAKAVPAVWDVMSPEEAIALRDNIVERAFPRLLGDLVDTSAFGEAADLLRRAAEGLDLAGRPLYAAHASLAWPTSAHGILSHAATLLREYRFDGHNAALLASDIDGVEAHVLMAGTGRGNKASILPIRGLTSDEWDQAVGRLAKRGWAEPDGTLTPTGASGRKEIEALTNRLAAEPVRRLAATGGVAHLEDLLTPTLQRLNEQDLIPGSWPPKHLMKP